MKIIFRTLSLTSLPRRWINHAYTIYDYHKVITYVFLYLLFVHLVVDFCYRLLITF